MSNCSENFKVVFNDIQRGEEKLFSVFVNPPTGESIEDIKEKIADKAIELSKKRAEDNNIVIESYNYNEAINKLKLLASSKRNPLPGLTDDVIDDIVSLIQQKINVENNNYLTNPLVTNDQGELVPLFDMSNLSKLVNNMDTMEKFIEEELQFGLLKVIFINTLGRDEQTSEEYEPFVVTNTALNKNMLVYKNELWRYIVDALHIEDQDIKDSNLYVNGRLNTNLFSLMKDGKTIYSYVLSKVKDEMQSRFGNKTSSKYIRIYPTEGKFSLAQAYLKAIILANFDNFLVSKQMHRVSLNVDSINTFAIPSNGEPKYRLAFRWSKIAGIDNDEKADGIDENSTSLVKMLADVITYYENVEDKSKRKGVSWRKNRNLTIGKNNLDSLGAIANGFYEDIRITISERRIVTKGDEQVLESNKFDISIGEAFKRYDRGELTFKQILSGMIDSIDVDDDLKSREAPLISLYNFLYSDNGLANKFSTWKKTHPDMADFAVNPEVAIINHIRNTVKVKYRREVYVGTGTTVDALNLNSTIKDDFTKLSQNLTRAWKSGRVNASDVETIRTIDDYLNFISDPKKGGMELSNRTRELFKSKFGKDAKDSSKIIDFNSPVVKSNLKLLMSISGYEGKTIETMSEQGELLYDSVNEEDVAEILRSNIVDSSLKLIELFKDKHYVAKYNVVTQIKNRQGNSLPTMGIANPGSLFNIVLASAPKNSIFKENPKLYQGVEVLDEVVGKSKIIGVDELYSNELLKLGFIRHFLMSGINEDKFIIQPWNFSDKSKIFGLGINASTLISGRSRGLRSMSVDMLKDELFNRQKTYYSGLLNNIIRDFQILDPKYFSGVNTLSTTKSPENNIKIIEKYLSTVIKTKDALSRKVNEVFNRDENNYVDMVEDLHYSTYNKVLHFNQFLKANILIYNDRDGLFEEWINKKRGDLLSYVNKNMGIISVDDIITPARISRANKVKKLSEYFNISPSDLFVEEKVEGSTNYYLRLTNRDSDTELSEILTKFLLTKNLIISQYANITVKDAFLHPFSGTFNSIDLDSEDSWKLFTKEEAGRTTAFTKRMNIPGASMSIYGKGPNGISTTIKIAAIADPIAPAYNFTGDKTSQKTMDGGGWSNPFFNELTIWSMPGLDLKRTQKPIGESMNAKYSTTLKFATYAMNNELIRFSMNAGDSVDPSMKGRPLYELMKKMNSISLYEVDTDGHPIYRNILETVDSEGNADIFQIQEIFKGLEIPIKGVYRQFIQMRWIKDTNKYEIVYKSGVTSVGTHEVTINNLFDLWEAFGGAFSGRMTDSGVEYTEDSIDIVSSIIKKHSSTSSPLNLKDKMIALALPPSSIKKGAANINSEDIVYNSSNKLSYFNFDTSFFGVQLDAFHSTEDSETNEITQALSALSENAATPEFYNATYESIGNIITNGLRKFNITVSEKGGINKVMDVFIRNLNNSSQINNSRALINSISEDLSKVIPLNNKTIYKQFITHVVSSVNTDFIRRKFPGSSSVLNPSQGTIRVYEDRNGKIYMPTDILKLVTSIPIALGDIDAINQSDISEYAKNEKKINLILSKHELFQPQEVTLSELEPVDKIQVTMADSPDPVMYDLSDIDKYYNVKKELANNPNVLRIEKIFNKTRDLRPVRINFETVAITNAGTVISKKNIFDLDSLKFSWWLSSNKNQLLSKGLVSDNGQFTFFKDFVARINSEFATATLERKLDLLTDYSKRWVSREFDMLSYGLTMGNYDAAVLTNPGKNPFDVIFSYTNNTGKVELDQFTYRYQPTNLYAGQIAIRNYVHRNAENIHSNVHKGNFKLGDTPLANVTREFFLEKINRAVKRKPWAPYDVMLSNYDTGETLYVIMDGGQYEERNNRLFRGDKEVGRKIFIQEEERSSGDRVRLSNFGNSMYTMPRAYSMFVNNNGAEILFIKKTDDVSPLEQFDRFISGLRYFNIIRLNDYNNFISNLRQDVSRDTLVNFIDRIVSATDDKYLRRYLNIKKSNYINFRESLKNVTTLTNEQLKKAYDEYLATTDKQILSNYASNLANVIYQSWRYSNTSLSARIPAQALQSIMSMDTIGYISGDANDVFVSHWQLWLQGSDFDIDKLYMMMYDFNNGIFYGWSPYFDILDPQNSFKLPMPNEKAQYSWIDAKGENTAEQEKVNKKTLMLEPVSLENTLELDEFLLNDTDTNQLFKLQKVLNHLKANEQIKYIRSKDPGLVIRIRRHNKFFSEEGFKNFIVYNLLETSRSPRNQVASYDAISFGIYDDLKKTIESNMSLSLYDGYSMGQQQEQNIIGRKVIGMAATGLKAYFGLVKYYSDFFNSGKVLTPTSNGYFIKTFNLNGKVYAVNKISGLNLEKLSREILRDQLLEGLTSESFWNKSENRPFTREEIVQMVNSLVEIKPDSDAALNISRILSLATDNAKELMLAKINAGTDFAGMHIYLAMMGIDERTVTDYMTSPQVKAIKEKLSRDIFERDFYDPSIYTRLNRMYTPKFKEYKEALRTDPNNFERIANLREAVLKEAASNKKDPKKLYDQFFLDEFFRIYEDSRELVTLGGLFKVNQGSKATQENLYELSQQLQKIINIREHSYFSNFVVNPELSAAENLQRKIDYITYDKKYLANNRAYIERVLASAEVAGISNGGKVDAYRYFSDEAYRNTVTDFYNLLKLTFNVFDVMNNLPHFYNMYRSFIEAERFLASTVNKYYIIKNVIPDILEIGKAEDGLDSWDIDFNTRPMHNKNLRVSFSKEMLDSINDFYDSVVISKFLKQGSFKISLKALMAYLGIKEINLLKNDKDVIAYTKIKLNDIVNLEKPIIIDLSNEFGIAQFRYLMEEYIIPHVKGTSAGRNNGFLKEYIFTPHKNFNLASRIMHYLDKSNFADLENLEIGMNRIVNDTEGDFNIPIRAISETASDTYNRIENFKFIDLLSLYDLIVNEGRFGGNRATIFMYKDIDNANSVARQFISLQNEVSNSKEFTDEIRDRLTNNKNFRYYMYLRLFGKQNADGGMSAELNSLTKLTVNNRYFTLFDELESAAKGTPAIYLSKEIVDLINASGIAMDVICGEIK